jgi:hypothetical protein
MRRVHHPEMFQPHIGVDESGKGDFFGPLVIAGVYVDGDVARRLREIGAVDSKRISSDERIAKIAAEIRQIPGLAWEVISIHPERYNELARQIWQSEPPPGLGTRESHRKPARACPRLPACGLRSVREPRRAGTRLAEPGPSHRAGAANQSGERSRRGGRFDPGAGSFCPLVEIGGSKNRHRVSQRSVSPSENNCSKPGQAAWRRGFAISLQNALPHQFRGAVWVSFGLS